ncbi:MAG: desulfoferrodoxin [Patescibacteria group bacterium]|nr:desulfoferrodoxin [Patescibacteria group bacterium]
MANVQNKKEIFKCSVCGNIVEVLHVGGAELVCCGQSMDFQAEKTQDEGSEKHIPVIEKTENGFKVTVGSVEHPMEQDHHIEWIELIVDGNFYARKFLSVGKSPQAEFDYSGDGKVGAREYCNLHGLWKA